MSSFEDVIEIQADPQRLEDLLADLLKHPEFFPDGFKLYRYLTLETRGKGARASLVLDLLGYWLPAELEILDASLQGVSLRLQTSAARLTLHLQVTPSACGSRVNLTAQQERRRLAPWRVRTRVKQLFRLEKDVARLLRPLLPQLRRVAEGGSRLEGTAEIHRWRTMDGACGGPRASDEPESFEV